MLSSKPLYSLISNLNKARYHRYVLNKRFMGLLPTSNILREHNIVCRRHYSSEEEDKNIPGFKSDKIKPEKCPPDNLMSMSPQPKKPFQEEFDKMKKRNMRIFYIGLVILIVSVAATIKSFKTEKKTEPKKKSKKRIIPKNPVLSSDIPPKIPYLLIGGGTASFSAFRAIKSNDPTAQVLMITEEPFLPYMRPPLSKEMWFNDDKDKVEKLIFRQWNGTERSLLYEPEEFYTPIAELVKAENDKGGISVASGYKVVEIDPYCHKVKLDNGYEIEYEKALIATGAKPKMIPVIETAKSDKEIRKRVQELRNIWDFEDLQAAFKDSFSVAVVGGGFLGSELACALARLGNAEKKVVYQIFKERGNLGKVLPEYLSSWTTDKVIKEGVQVKPNAEVVSCVYNQRDKIIDLRLNTGEVLRVEQIVVCTGAVPDMNLAINAGLEVDPELGGYLVNSELQARTDLYVAGDAACFYDPKFGRRRVEHHDHAVVTGRLAGENMTGAHKPYIHQSMFWSDLGPDIGFEAIGLVDSKLPTVGVFAKAQPSDTPKAHITETDSNAVRTRVEINQAPPHCDVKIGKDEKRDIEVSTKTEREDLPPPENPDDFGKGVVFYMRNDKIVGVVLWNVFNRIQTARQILKEDKTYDDLNEVAKLFNIHQD